LEPNNGKNSNNSVLTCFFLHSAFCILHCLATHTIYNPRPGHAPGSAHRPGLGTLHPLPDRADHPRSGIGRCRDPSGGDPSALIVNPATLSRLDRLGVWASLAWVRPNLGFTELDRAAQVTITSVGTAGQSGALALAIWYHRVLASDLDLSQIPVVLDTLNLPALLRSHAFLNRFGLTLAWKPLPVIRLGASGHLGYFGEAGVLPTLLVNQTTLPATVDYQRTGYGFSAGAGVLVEASDKLRFGLAAELPMDFNLDELWRTTDPYGFFLGSYSNGGHFRKPGFADFGFAAGPFLGWELSGAVRYDAHSHFRNTSESPDFLSFYLPTDDEITASIGIQAGILAEYLTIQAGFGYIQPVNMEERSLLAEVRNRYGLAVESGILGIQLALGARYERSRTSIQLLERTEVLLTARWGEM